MNIPLTSSIQFVSLRVGVGLWMLLALVFPVSLRAHEEIPGAGVQNFTRLIEGTSNNYRVELM
ncbi:MAG: hypothetical protein HYX73_10780 [Acidobacteria bacterium]|nr:hypothetical protein [Acidobacteriota bacterium]